MLPEVASCICVERKKRTDLALLVTVHAPFVIATENAPLPIALFSVIVLVPLWKEEPFLNQLYVAPATIGVVSVTVKGLHTKIGFPGPVSSAFGEGVSATVGAAGGTSTEIVRTCGRDMHPYMSDTVSDSVLFPACIHCTWAAGAFVGPGIRSGAWTAH